MGAGASSCASSEVRANFGELVRLTYCNPLEIRWSIRDYSVHCEGINCITSQEFTSEHQIWWKIILFPYGYNDACKDFVSIYIQSESHTDINCKNHKAVLRSKREDEYSPKIQKEYQMFGYNKFMSRNDLLTKLKDCDDELIVICRIKCEAELTPRTYTLNIELSHNYKTSILELLGDFGELLKNAELTDVELIAEDGKLFKAHKAVLAARSTVFLAMFQNDMLERYTGIVKIKDFSGIVLEQVLKFIYTTKSDINDDTVKDILLAANKYDLGALKRECVDYLRSSINISNAVELLEFAEEYDVNDLRIKAQLFIADNAEDITQQSGFTLKNLHHEAVQNLFRQMAVTNKK